MRKIFSLIIILAVVLSGLSMGVEAATQGSMVKTDMPVISKGRIIGFERQPVIINGRMLVPARTALSEVNARVEWYPEKAYLKIVDTNTAIGMAIGDPVAKVNGIEKDMGVAPVLVRGTVMVPLRFAVEALDSKVAWDPVNRAVRIGEGQDIPLNSRGGKTYTVVVDAGHGGRDPGAMYGGVKEKDLNLDIARRLNLLLQKEGIKTYMTRIDDSYVGLYERSGLANRVNADLFVSVHNNAGSSGANGSMTLYYPGTGHSKGNLSTQEFAYFMQNGLSSAIGTKNLGIIQRPNLAVLRTTEMPAVIAEVGYMSNRNELNKLKDPAFRQKVAEGLKDSIIASLRRI